MKASKRKKVSWYFSSSELDHAAESATSIIIKITIIGNNKGIIHHDIANKVGNRQQTWKSNDGDLCSSIYSSLDFHNDD